MISVNKKDKIRQELVLLDEITYGVEPRYYYDSGIRKIYKFIDIDFNIYVWMTSKFIGKNIIDEKGNERYEMVEPGDKIILEGTVKDLNQYRGEDQIVLTRCNVDEIVDKQFMSERTITDIRRKIQLSRFNNPVIKTVTYKDYKNKYQNCETLVDSFVRDEDGCYIDVILAREKTSSLYYYSN